MASLSVSGVTPGRLALSRRQLLAGLAALAALRPTDLAAAPAGVIFDDAAEVMTLTGAINGHEAALIIDSGAGAVLIDQAFAKRIELAEAPGVALGHGFTATTRGKISSPFALTLGETTVEVPRAMLLDLSAVASTGVPVEVIVGRDLFDRFAVEIDFAERRLFLHAPGTYVTDGARRTVLRSGPLGLRLIEISVEGRKPGWAIFDLGAGIALTMDRVYARREGLLRGRTVSTAASAVAEGIIAHDVFTAARLSVAGVELSDVPAHAVPNWLKGKDAQLNIGYPAISRLGRVIVDYAADSLYIFPRSTPAPPIAKNLEGLGLAPLPGGGWEVKHVARGGPAARAGWKTGEVIATIDARSTLSPAERAASREAGSRVVYVMADGSRRELVRAVYY